MISKIDVLFNIQPNEIDTARINYENSLRNSEDLIEAGKRLKATSSTKKKGNKPAEA